MVSPASLFRAQREGQIVVRQSLSDLQRTLFDRCPKKTGTAARSIEVTIDDLSSEAYVTVTMPYPFLDIDVFATMHVFYGPFITDPWFLALSRDWHFRTYRQAYAAFSTELVNTL